MFSSVFSKNEYAIYVATPSQTHAEVAIQVIKAGKAVYVKKPMAMADAECWFMEQLINIR
jgi:predicted dehydrogenase